MKAEPTLIIELVRLFAFFLGLMGIVITPDEEKILVAGIGGLVALVSLGLAVWNRSKVFSPATTQKVADRAAATGNTDIGEPPTGALAETP